MGKKMTLKETDSKKVGQQHRNLGDADWDGDGVCRGWEMSTSHGRF